MQVVLRRGMPAGLAVVVALLLAAPSLAADSSSGSWWNPLNIGGKSTSSSSKSPASRDSGTKTSLTSGARSKKSKEPGTWDKVTTGTKNFFNSLNPWADDSKDSASSKGSGASRKTNVSATKPRGKSNEKGVFSSWMSPEPEEEKINSVNDFLKLPKPQ